MDMNIFWIIFFWISSQGIYSQLNGEITCGNAKQLFEGCFANDSSNISKLTLKNTHNIPFNNDEISRYCRVFDRGLSCYKEYADKCLHDQTTRRLIEGEIMPARNFYDMLCKDKEFVKDYLKHSSCFRHIEKDWRTCTLLFHDVTDKEFTRSEREKKSNINTQYMHFCCARFAYENCVYNSARAKCTPESAKFTKSLVELLSSERQFKNCGRIEGALCGAASTTGYFLYPIYIGFLITNLFCKLFVPT